MIFPLIFVALGRQATTVELVPTDDVWAYAHASDATTDPFLRVWGDGERAVAPAAEDIQSFSYSYLKFKLPKLPAGKLETATLVLWHIQNPAYSVEQAKEKPLQVRPFRTDWTEKGYDHEFTRTNGPFGNDKKWFGTGYPTEIGTDAPFAFKADLTKGELKLGEYLAKADAGDHVLAFALTAALDPNELGNKGVYKFFSRNNDKESLKPKLILTFVAGQ